MIHKPIMRWRPGRVLNSVLLLLCQNYCERFSFQVA